MSRTAEQVTADNALDAAVRRCATAYEVVGDGEVITGWVLAGAATDGDESQSNYFSLHPGGVQPTHIAVGLLRCAEANLLTGGDEE